jgi:hypothetical protein
MRDTFAMLALATALFCMAAPHAAGDTDTEVPQALREKILDELEVPESARDSDIADALAEDELTLSQRRALRHQREEELAALAGPEPDSPDAAIEGSPPALGVYRPPPPWIAPEGQLRVWLPRVSIGVGGTRTSRRREFHAVARADFPLGTAPRRLVAAAAGTMAGAVPDTASPSPPAAHPLPRDEDGDCLDHAREAALTLTRAGINEAGSLVSRARHAAWLPELRVRVERRLGRSESLDLPPDGGFSSKPVGLDVANDVRYEARATWDLARLVFGAEELAASALAMRMMDTRRDLATVLNRLYFERRRLRAEARFDPGADPIARLRRAVRVEEIEADLDALSGGAFGECRARRHGGRWH